MTVRILQGDCRDVLKTLPDESVHCVVTSPPYFGLRDYGAAGQIGLEKEPHEYVAAIVEVFIELRRILRPDGIAWLNLGDSYAGSGKGGNPPDSEWAGFVGNSAREAAATVPAGEKRVPAGLKAKDLIGIPWRVAFALQAGGWWLRQDVIWAKPNPMPESVRDRCTKAHEYIFLLSKSERYYYDAAAIAEPFADERNGNPGGGGQYAKEAFAYAGPNAQSGLQKGVWNEDGSKVTRNKRSVWTVPTQSFRDAHFATFPPDLIEPCILAGCPVGGTVLDPFGGAGTTGLVADRLQRHAILVELNTEYADLAKRRITGDAPLFAEVVVP